MGIVKDWIVSLFELIDYYAGRLLGMHDVGRARYCNIDFEVIGHWVKPRPEHRAADPGDCEPAEAGYFEDYKIMIGTLDVTELLSTEATGDILDLAAEDMLR